MSITMEQLRSCRTLMREIEAIEGMRGRIGDYRNGLASIAFAGDYHTGGNMRESAAWQALDGVDEKYREKITEYACIVFLVEQAISALLPEQREIMRLRYVVRMKWDEIAEKVHYSKRWCTDQRKEALLALGIDDDEIDED